MKRGVEGGQNPPTSWALTHIFNFLKTCPIDLIFYCQVALEVIYHTAVFDLFSTRKPLRLSITMQSPIFLQLSGY